jgi:hypothetical protein
MGDERALLGLLFVPSRVIDTNKEHMNERCFLEILQFLSYSPDGCRKLNSGWVSAEKKLSLIDDK